MAIVNIIKEPEYYLPAAITDDGKLGLMSYEESLKLSGIASGAEVNQNAFSTIKVGSTNVVADNKTDTLELVAGNNITLTPDANNDKITILSKNSFPEVGTGLGYTSTVSGNPITVTDALPYPAVSLSAEIEPIQDLHGYDKPWVGGANVQLVDFSNYQALSNNVSFDYTDGDVTLRSTGTTPNYTLVEYNITSLKGKTLYFADTFTTSDEGLGHIQIIYSVGGQTSYVEVGRNPNPQTGYSIPNNAELVNLRLYMRNGTSIESGKWVKYGKIMCASSANPTYSPYANECPILGRDSVAVTRSNGDEISEDFTIQLGQTVYGGTLNVTTGVLTVTHVIKALDADDITYGYSSGTQRISTASLQSVIKAVANTDVADIICSCFVKDSANGTATHNIDSSIAVDNTGVVYIYSSLFTDASTFKTAMSGQTICYELATPTTIQLTPEQLTMLKGYNRLSSDGGGDITLTYLADSITGSETGKPLALSLKSDTLSTLTASSKGNTTDREYAVGLDKNGNLSVNVPWPTIITSTTDLEDGTSPLATGAIYLVYET